MKGITELTIYKHLEIPDNTIENVIIDGLLSNNYSFPVAQNIAENVTAGQFFKDDRKQLYISKILVLDAIRRYCSRNIDIEIEMFSESANEIFDILRENYKTAVC